MPTSGNLKLGDILILDHVPPTHSPNFFINAFWTLNQSPHKLKVPKMNAYKPKSSKISQQYNHPWQENAIFF